jgi:hypothetical protein
VSRCYVGERIARRIVRRRSGGWCEVCDRRRATEWHHRINRSQGGEWRASNGLDTCSACHLHITTNPHAARQQGWHLYPGEHPAAMRVWLARRGWCLLSDPGDVTPVDNDPRYVHPW